MQFLLVHARAALIGIFVLYVGACGHASATQATANTGHSGDGSKLPVRLQIGEVHGPTSDQWIAKEIRRLWRQQIKQARMDRGKSRTIASHGRLYRLTSRVTRWTDRHLGDRNERLTSCDVHVMLENERGSIVMITNGGATMQTPSKRTAVNPDENRVIARRVLAQAVGAAFDNIRRYLSDRHKDASNVVLALADSWPRSR